MLRQDPHIETAYNDLTWCLKPALGHLRGGTPRGGIGVLGRSLSQKTSPTHGAPLEGAFRSSQAGM